MLCPQFMLIPPPQAASHAEKMRVSLILMNDPQTIIYIDIFTKKFTSGIISVSSRSSCIFSCPLGCHWVLPFPPWLHHIVSTHIPLWRAYTQASYSSRDSHFPLSTSCLYSLFYKTSKKWLNMINEHSFPWRGKKVWILTLYAWPIPPLSAMFSPSVLIPLSCLKKDSLLGFLETPLTFHLGLHIWSFSGGC